MRHMLSWTALAGGALLLTACEARIGDPEAADANATGPVSAEGKAEDGRVTIKAPGVDISVQVPDRVARQATADSHSGVIPPGSRFSGVHIEGGGSGRGGAVELRFTSDRPPADLAGWYQGQSGSGEFTVSEARAEGQGQRVAGTTRDGGEFVVHLQPGEGGGTSGRVAITER